MIAAFIQARMSSRRFPGKVLAPFRGRPLVAHVIDRVRRVESITADSIVVLTSTDPSDDPVAAYARSLDVGVFRGSLDNVFDRFQQCARGRRVEWIVRVNADSPLIDPTILRTVIARAASDCDLVTTIAPRTLPKGQNPEVIRASLLLDADMAGLSADEREHVTSYFYKHPGRFRIVNVRSDRPELAGANLSVDTVDDLRRLEAMSQASIDALLDVSLA